MQQVGGGVVCANPRFIQSLEGGCLHPRKKEDRSAHRNVYQKTTEVEGAYRNESGGDQGVLVIHIDRLGDRLLRCGIYRQRRRKVHSVQKAWEWRDLSMRKLPLKLRY